MNRANREIQGGRVGLKATRLNVDTQAKPIKQKKRSFGMECNRIIEKEVENKACPKDPYLLPQIELLVDSTIGFALFSMMNAYQGYHQIFMAEEDRDMTSFITENAINCYDVIWIEECKCYLPFGNRMLKNLIGKTIEMV
ncbi:hypothetical protein Sango_1919400 [Sesamum angolense]|uniref:Reverse transcriptase domain-containing protein n=1 Tax=Sesamum angolense TaxID=2727404 RepID=A0AAE2BN13_9LAMI|nr:hypothetical protein Sango_1919400 [Sesamum angolense]